MRIVGIVFVLLFSQASRTRAGILTVWIEDGHFPRLGGLNRIQPLLYITIHVTLPRYMNQEVDSGQGQGDQEFIKMTKGVQDQNHPVWQEGFEWEAESVMK